jgi:hypothetical protein
MSQCTLYYYNMLIIIVIVIVIIKILGLGCVSQEPNKHKALSSNPALPPKKKKKKELLMEK